MTSLSTDFTDKLFAEYEANAKYSAIENAVTHNGLLKSIETRQSEVENDHVFSIDLTKDEVSNPFGYPSTRWWTMGYGRITF